MRDMTWTPNGEGHYTNICIYLYMHMYLFMYVYLSKNKYICIPGHTNTQNNYFRNEMCKIELLK